MKEVLALLFAVAGCAVGARVFITPASDVGAPRAVQASADAKVAGGVVLARDNLPFTPRHQDFSAFSFEYRELDTNPVWHSDGHAQKREPSRIFFKVVIRGDRLGGGMLQATLSEHRALSGHYCVSVKQRLSPSDLRERVFQLEDHGLWVSFEDTDLRLRRVGHATYATVEVHADGQHSASRLAWTLCNDRPTYAIMDYLGCICCEEPAPWMDALRDELWRASRSDQERLDENWRRHLRLQRD